MFEVKDKRLLPYQLALFGALGAYLWKLGKVNASGGTTKVSIDTEKLAKAAMPYIPAQPQFAGAVQEGLKKTLDVVFEKVKK